MKTLCILILLCIALAPASAAPHSTAIYVREHVGELEGRAHRLRVSRVLDHGPDGEGHRWLFACTEGTDGSLGGWIYLLAPADGDIGRKVPRDRYYTFGANIVGRRIAGIVRVRKSDQRIYLDCTVPVP